MSISNLAIYLISIILNLWACGVKKTNAAKTNNK